jgi:hypothetical protein
MRTSAAWIFNVASDRTKDGEETSPYVDRPWPRLGANLSRPHQHSARMCTKMTTGSRRGGQLLHARQAVTQAAQYGSSRGLLWLAMARDCPAWPIHLGHRVPADPADLSRSQSTRKPAAEHFQSAEVRSPPLWL